MNKIDLKTLDLNLLRAFDALMTERNVTRAGLQMNMSQSSMSHALGRLRRLTGDPLFVRLPDGMEPTTLALRIAGPIRDGIALMQNGMDNAIAFDPAQSDRTFQLLLSDIGEMVYLPSLIVKIGQVAPHVNLRVLQLPREVYRETFLAGNADLAIGFLPGLQAGFYQQRLFDDSYVCLVRADHPRVGKRLTLRQFAQESHVLIEPAGSRYSHASQQSSTTTLIERHLAEQGLHRRIALRVPHFMVVPNIVQKTDLLAIVPSQVGNHLHPLTGLKMLPLPIDVPRFEVKQFWHERSHHDPANQWLRHLISDMFMKPPKKPRSATATT